MMISRFYLKKNIDIVVTEYNVNLFKKLRRLENLDEDKIIEMIQPKNGTNDLIQLNNDSLFLLVFQ